MRTLAVLAIAVLATTGAARPHAGASAHVAPPLAARLDTAILAGGCFWGVEGVFERIRGVKVSESGYTGGNDRTPTYEEVSAGIGGHAEAVRVIFDPAVVSYGTLLQVFFSVVHDPTELNRQGPDVGTQYRSAIFYTGPVQKKVVEDYIAQLTAAKTFRGRIVTQVAPLTQFHVAESYHQDYMAKHPDQPYIVINDAPKVEHLKKLFPALLK